MMPPFVADVDMFIADRLVPHMDKILCGEESVFISPQYSNSPDGKSGPLFYQLFFDIDTKHVGQPRAMETASKIVQNLDRVGVEYFFENSVTGVHIFSRHCYEIDFSYEKIKQKYGKQFTVSYPGFDYVSSLRNVPIPRVGSYNKQVLIKVQSTLEEAFNDRTNELPGNVMSEQQLIRFWMGFLFPKRASRYISQMYRDMFIRGMN